MPSTWPSESATVLPRLGQAWDQLIHGHSYDRARPNPARPAMPHASARGPHLAGKGRARLAAGPWAMGSADVRASGYVIFCAGLAGVLLLGRMYPRRLRTVSQRRHGLSHRVLQVTGSEGIHVGHNEGDPRNLRLQPDLDVRTSAARLTRSFARMPSAVAGQRAPQPVTTRGQPRLELGQAARARLGIANVRRADTPRPTMRRRRRSCGSSPRLRNSISAGPAIGCSGATASRLYSLCRHHQPRRRPSRRAPAAALTASNTRRPQRQPRPRNTTRIT